MGKVGLIISCPEIYFGMTGQLTSSFFLQSHGQCGLGTQYPSIHFYLCVFEFKLSNLSSLDVNKSVLEKDGSGMKIVVWILYFNMAHLCNPNF